MLFQQRHRPAPAISINRSARPPTPQMGRPYVRRSRLFSSARSPSPVRLCRHRPDFTDNVAINSDLRIVIRAMA
jgi:hypothetical protein